MTGFSDQFQTELSGAQLTPRMQATLRLGPGGRVVVPANIREAMGLKQGDAMLATLEGTELRLVTVNETIRQLQEIAKSFAPEGVSLVDEFIAERRAEALRESEE